MAIRVSGATPIGSVAGFPVRLAADAASKREFVVEKASGKQTVVNDEPLKSVFCLG